MFSNQKFEEFTLFIGEFIEEILTKRIKITNGFFPFFRKIPKILDGIIANDNSSIVDAQNVVGKLTLLIDQQAERPQGKTKFTRDFKPESANIIKDELRIEQKDLKSKMRMDLN